MDFLGIVLMVGGLLLGFYAIIATGFFAPNTSWGRLCIGLAPYAVAVRLLDRSPRYGDPDPRWRDRALSGLGVQTAPREEPDAQGVVAATRSGSILEIGGLGALKVQATARLLELQSFGPDKADKRHEDPRSGATLREFKAVTLSGNRLLVEHPESEGGPLRFFLYESERTPAGFPEMLSGTREEPGPAARFAKSGQSGEVTLEALGRTWQLKDIIWVDVENESGRLFVRPDHGGKKARVAMLLSVNTANADEWMLFADLRSGQGSDTLWVGRQFDPGIDIEV